MKVLVVQRHLLLAEAISSVLEHSKVDVVGIATTGRSALEALPRAAPDVLLLDLALPDMCGLEVGRRALQMMPGVKILMLTTAENPGVTARNALQAGFHGFLPTEVSTSRLIESLRLVCSGQAILLPHHATAAVTSERRPHVHEHALLMQLTNREQEILRLLASGASSKEIASRLTITANTVRSHVQNLMAKLGVNNRLKAVMLASAHGLLGGRDDTLMSPD